MTVTCGCEFCACVRIVWDYFNFQRCLCVGSVGVWAELHFDCQFAVNVDCEFGVWNNFNFQVCLHTLGYGWCWAELHFDCQFAVNIDYELGVWNNFNFQVCLHTLGLRLVLGRAPRSLSLMCVCVCVCVKMCVGMELCWFGCVCRASFLLPNIALCSWQFRVARA